VTPTKCDCGACFGCGGPVGPDGVCRPRTEANPITDSCGHTIIQVMPDGGSVYGPDGPPVCFKCGKPWPKRILDQIHEIEKRDGILADLI
jgi:hypothetical protein